MTSLWSTEPVLVSTGGALLASIPVWSAVFTLLAAFHHPLTPDQQAAIVGVITAVGAILGAVVGRSQVSPTAKPAPAPPPQGPKP